MTRRNSDKDSLGHLLKAEAQRAAPEFSPQLHARIMARLSSGAPGEYTDVGAGPLRMAPWTHGARPYLMLAAAALLVALSLWMWRHSGPQARQEIVTPGPVHLVPEAGPVPSLPPIDSLLATGVGAAQDRLDESRYAYLDRDAQSLAHYVWNQFDVVSSEP